MDELKPEEQARVLIDEMLAAAGWAVVPRSGYLDVPHALRRIVCSIIPRLKRLCQAFPYCGVKNLYWL